MSFWWGYLLGFFTPFAICAVWLLLLMLHRPLRETPPRPQRHLTVVKDDQADG